MTINNPYNLLKKKETQRVSVSTPWLTKSENENIKISEKVTKSEKVKPIKSIKGDKSHKKSNDKILEPVTNISICRPALCNQFLVGSDENSRGGILDLSSPATTPSTRRSRNEMDPALDGMDEFWTS